jgi:alpha-ketoglutarate-dependent taurine dioxygenase
MRKETGLAVSDRIALVVSGGEEVAAVVEAHGAWISEEVLATELVLLRDGTSEAEARQLQTIDLDEITARVAITRTE